MNQPSSPSSIVPLISTTSANGIHIIFSNGLTLSVQWQPAVSYCDNRKFSLEFTHRSTSYPCSNVELALWNCHGKWIRLGTNDDVVGWIPIDTLARLIGFLPTLTVEETLDVSSTSIINRGVLAGERK